MTAPDTQKLSELDEIGFVRIPSVLPRDKALGMRPLLMEAIETELARWGRSPNYNDSWMVHNLMVYGGEFLKILDNEVLHAYLDAAFSPTSIVYAYTSSSMPPYGSNFSRRMHVDSPRMIPGYLTNIGFFVALDDISVRNGAMLMLPRSQWREEPPSEEEFFRDAVPMVMQAGDAILFNARTWHMGGKKRNKRASSCYYDEHLSCVHETTF